MTGQSFCGREQSRVTLQVPVEELGVAVQGAEVADDGRFCASHVIHQDHGVRDVVQIHGHRDLNEAAQTGAAALARFSHFQILAEVRRKEMATIRDSVEQEERV